uniref:Murine leukemia virus integrase C-terminal domain-containing protein n=1 Tax=Cyprinus carpio carpio TaxID=630221 RepID=A0A9J7XDY5_CYPCA
MQAWASLEDKAAWKKAGATYEENVWLGPNKKTCLPKHWKQKRWTGPHLILLVTHTAVKVEGRGTWVHASHCRKLPSCGSDQNALRPTALTYSNSQ